MPPSRETAYYTRAVFAREHATRHFGTTVELRDGGVLTVGDVYQYDDHPEGTFPTEGKIYRFTGTGRFGPWGLDAVDEVTRVRPQTHAYRARVEMRDGARCEVFLGTSTAINCSCHAAGDLCPHALGALYATAEDAGPVLPESREMWEQLVRFRNIWRHDGRAVTLIAAADAGYAYAVRLIEEIHFGRMRRPEPPPLPVVALDEVLFG